jgi:hypothetical protein
VARGAGSANMNPETAPGAVAGAAGRPRKPYAPAPYARWKELLDSGLVKCGDHICSDERKGVVEENGEIREHRTLWKNEIAFVHMDNEWEARQDKRHLRMGDKRCTRERGGNKVLLIKLQNAICANRRNPTAVRAISKKKIGAKVELYCSEKDQEPEWHKATIKEYDDSRDRWYFKIAECTVENCPNCGLCWIFLKSKGWHW